MKKNNVLRLFLLFLFVLYGVSCNDSPKHDIELVVTNYAEAFYNYDYKTAAQFVTKESKPVIAFFSSNVSQSDLDQYNHSKKVKIKVTDIKLKGDSSDEAIVTLQVINSYQISLLNKIGTTIKEKDVFLCLKTVNGRWLVDLTANH